MIANAQSMTTSNTQEQVDTAAAALEAAIAKLIPVSKPNPTFLYEATHGYLYFYVFPGYRICEVRVSNDNTGNLNWVTEETATADSWALFSSVKSSAETVLNNWLSTDWTMTDWSVFTNAGDSLSEAIDALDMVVETQDRNKDGYNDYHLASLAYESLNNMLQNVYAPSLLKESNYTSESWSSFVNAYNEATEFVDAHERPSAGIGFKGCWAIDDIYDAFYDSSVNGLVSSKDAVGYTVYVVDNYHLESGEPLSDLAGTYTGTLNAESATVGAVMEAHNLNTLSRQMRGSASNKPIILGIYVNDLYIYRFSGYVDDGFGSASRGYNEARIHDGDVVVIALMRTPMDFASMISGDKPMSIEKLTGDIQYLTTSSGEVEAVSGEDIDLQVFFNLSLLTKYNGTASAKEGASVYVSDTCSTREEAVSAIAVNKANIVSDANGKYSLKLYSAPGSAEGWYSLNYIVSGEKGGLVNGANVLIHVTDPDDITGFKDELKAQLKEVYEAYPDDFYTAEQLSQITELYNDGLAAIDSATNTGDAQAAYDSAAEAIQAIQKTNTGIEETNLANIRFLLAGLPTEEDLEAGKLYKQDQFMLDGLQNAWSVMTAYQKSQLSAGENALVQKFLAQDASSLGDRPSVHVSLKVVDAETGTELEFGTGENQVPLRFRFWEGNYYTELNNTNGALSYKPAGKDRHYYMNVEDDLVTEFDLNGYWVGVICAGFPSSGNDYVSNGYVISRFDVNADEHYIETSGKITDGVMASPRVTALRDDLVITLYVTKDSGPSEEDLAQAKAAAKAALEKAYDAYDQSALNNAQKAALLEAKNAGLAAIDAANNKADVQAAYEAAIVAMKLAINSDTVHVIVENTTFTSDNALYDSDKYWSGTLVDTWVSINSGSTMMSLIETAITSTGHTGEGFDTGYISSIDGLGQFDGGQGSGWMGALNGWLTNEGFSGITVSEGDIKAGDEIRVMYTCDLGQDIGGATEGDTNTTLKELVIGNAVLTPVFDGSVTNYTLTIIDPDQPVTLTYTPANIAYQARAYLNNYDSRAEFWYESGSIIPVTPGDVIYVGVGDSAWPSMGNGMGTRYTIAVATGVQNVIAFAFKTDR